MNSTNPKLEPFMHCGDCLSPGHCSVLRECRAYVAAYKVSRPMPDESETKALLQGCHRATYIAAHWPNSLVARYSDYAKLERALADAIAQKTAQYDEWLDAVERLRESRDDNARLRELLVKYGDDSRDTIDGLTEENERLREALRFYADRAAYVENKGFPEYEYPVLEDGGARARAALDEEGSR